MSGLTKLSVPSTLVLLAVGFAALLGIVGMTFWLGERSQALFGEVVAARDARTSAVELRNALLAAESNARSYLVTGSEIYLSPYDRAKAQAERQLSIVGERFAPYDDMKPAMTRLDAVFEQRLQELDRTVALKRERRGTEASELVQTNRGKALMDEANVFLSGLIRAADARLTTSADGQRVNADRLRLVSIAGGVVVVLVVSAAFAVIFLYTRALRRARDDLSVLNTGLEDRVAARTEDLVRARDRAQLLLAEVNHRVANSLALVSSLVTLQTNALDDKVAKEVLAETQARIYAIAMVHKRLYGSDDVRAVALDEYLAALLDHLKTTLPGRTGIELSHNIAAVKLPTDASVNLGVVVTEWVTNAIKYAYPEGKGEIRVQLAPRGDQGVELIVEDDGVGRDEAKPTQGTGLGTRIVRAMAASMNAKVEYATRRPGTIARLIIPHASLAAAGAA